MISKWKINLIAFLISLTLFGVGFSSWSITANSVTETVEGTITVDSVEHALSNAGNMVILQDPEPFLYDDLGFVDSKGDSKGEWTSTGVVSVKFELNLSDGEENLRAHFSSSGADSLYFETTLTPRNTKDGVNLFDIYTPSYSASYVSLNGEALSTEDKTGIHFSSFSTEDGICKYAVRLNNILSEDFQINSTSVTKLVFCVNFTFTQDDNYEAFFNAINNTSFKFGVSAKISSYVDETGS